MFAKNQCSRVPLFLFTLLMVWFGTNFVSVVAQDSLDCNVFDVSIILDRSSSITPDAWAKAVNFTKALTTRFHSSYTRYAIYSFAASCTRVLAFTNDPYKLKATSENLLQGNETGTNPAICINLANADLSARVPKNVPLYVIVTDGAENLDVNGKNGKYYTDEARALGAQVYVIHVGVTNETANAIINEMASKPLTHYTFDIQTYFDLATQQFLDSLVTRAESSCLTASCEDTNSVMHLTLPSVTSGICVVYDSSAFTLGIQPSLILENITAVRGSGAEWICKLPHTLAPKQYAMSFESQGVQRSFSAVNIVSCSDPEVEGFCLNTGWALVRVSMLPDGVSAAICRIYPASAYTAGTTVNLTALATTPAVFISGNEWRCQLPSNLTAPQYTLSFEAAGVRRSLSPLNMTACASSTQAQAVCGADGSSRVVVSMTQPTDVSNPRCRLYSANALVNASTAGFTPVVTVSATVASAGQWVCVLPATVNPDSYAFVFETANVQRYLAAITVIACSTPDVSVVCGSGGSSSIAIRMQYANGIDSGVCRFYSSSALAAFSVAGLPVLASVPAPRMGNSGNFRCVVSPGLLPETQYAMVFEAAGAQRALSPVSVLNCASVKTEAYCSAYGVSVVGVTLTNITVRSSARCVILHNNNNNNNEIASVAAIALSATKMECLMPSTLEAGSYIVRFEADSVQRALEPVNVLFCASVQSNSFCENGLTTINVTMPALPTQPNSRCLVFNSSALVTGTSADLTPFAIIPAVGSAGGVYRCPVPTSLPADSYALVFQANGANRSLAPLTIRSCGSFETGVVCLDGVNVVTVAMSQNPVLSNGHCAVYPRSAINGSKFVGGNVLALPIAFNNGNGYWRCELPSTLAPNEYAFTLAVNSVVLTFNSFTTLSCSTDQLESSCVNGGPTVVVFTNAASATATTAMFSVYSSEAMRRPQGVAGLTALQQDAAVKLPNGQWRCSLSQVLAAGSYALSFEAAGFPRSLNFVDVVSCATITTQTSYCSGGVSVVNVTVPAQPVVADARCVVYDTADVTAKNVPSVAIIPATDARNGVWQCVLPLSLESLQYVVAFESNDQQRARSLITRQPCIVFSGSTASCGENDTSTYVVFAVSNAAVVGNADCDIYNSSGINSTTPAGSRVFMRTVEARLRGDNQLVCVLSTAILPAGSYEVELDGVGIKPVSVPVILTTCLPLINAPSSAETFPYWTLFFLVILVPILFMVYMALRVKRPEKSENRNSLEMQTMSSSSPVASSAASSALEKDIVDEKHSDIPPPPPPPKAEGEAKVAAFDGAKADPIAGQPKPTAFQPHGPSLS